MWFKKKNRIPKAIIADIEEDKCDFTKLFSNINERSKVGQLYKELSLICHPDRYETEPQKKVIAVDLFQRLQSCRNNYQEMTVLKNVIIEKLTKQ